MLQHYLYEIVVDISSHYPPGKIPSNARNYTAHRFNTCLYLWLRLAQVRGRRIVRWRSAHVSFHQRRSRLDLHRHKLYPAIQAGFSFTSALDLRVVYRQYLFLLSISLYFIFRCKYGVVLGTIKRQESWHTKASALQDPS